MPLLLKWFGGADTDPEVPRYFALAVRGFSLIYFVLPSLLAYALLMDALSVAAIAAMTSPLILLLFSRPTEWSTQQWNGVTGLLGIVIVFTMGWQMKRRVSLRRRDGLSNVGMPVVLLASFLVAYAGVMRRTALDYDAIFSRPMSVTRSADKLIRGIDSLATFRRDAEAMAVAGIVPALAESEKGLKLHDGELSQQYRALHRAILGNTNHLDSTNANMWSGTESSLVSGLSRELGSVRVFAGAVRVLAGARVKSTASAYVRDSTRIAKAQELSRTQGNAALKSAAQQLLAVARRQTQKAWATELQRVQAAGQVALVLLLAALGIATAQAANAQRKRAVVLLCGVAVLALPTLRPVFADALDPLHPLTTFSLPTSSVAGLALSAVPGAHDPKKDLGVPESSVGVTQDSSLVVLLRSMKESVGAVSSKLDGAKEVLSSVDGRLAEQKP